MILDPLCKRGWCTRFGALLCRSSPIGSAGRPCGRAGSPKLCLAPLTKMMLSQAQGSFASHPPSSRETPLLASDVEKAALCTDPKHACARLLSLHFRIAYFEATGSRDHEPQGTAARNAAVGTGRRRGAEDGLTCSVFPASKLLLRTAAIAPCQWIRHLERAQRRLQRGNNHCGMRAPWCSSEL